MQSARSYCRLLSKDVYTIICQNNSCVSYLHNVTTLKQWMHTLLLATQTVQQILHANTDVTADNGQCWWPAMMRYRINCCSTTKALLQCSVLTRLYTTCVKLNKSTTNTRQQWDNSVKQHRDTMTDRQITATRCSDKNNALVNIQNQRHIYSSNTNNRPIGHWHTSQPECWKQTQTIKLVTLVKFPQAVWKICRLQIFGMQTAWNNTGLTILMVAET